MFRKSSYSRRRLASSLLPVAVGGLLGSCCYTPEYSVDDMQGRFDFAWNAALDLRFTSEMRTQFGGELSTWAGAHLATSANFDFSFDGQTAYEQDLKVDMDDDGVGESILALTLSDGGPAEASRGFVSWKGDAYSFDENYCNVFSWSEASAWILSAECNGGRTALVCSREEDKRFSCQACDPEHNCVSCDSSSVEGCLETGAERLAESPPRPTPEDPIVPSLDAATGEVISDDGSSSTGALVDAGVELDASGELNVDTDDEVNISDEVSVDGASEAELDTCRSQARSLDSDGQDCGQDALDIESLCESRWLDVNACALAVAGAGLFGSACDVINSTVCEGVY